MNNRYINTSETVAFEITSDESKYVNSTTTIMFMAESYDGSVPILQTVLDFVEITGGVF